MIVGDGREGAEHTLLWFMPRATTGATSFWHVVDVVIDADDHEQGDGDGDGDNDGG